MRILRFGARYWDARDIWSTQTTISYYLQVSKEQEELVTHRQEDEGSFNTHSSFLLLFLTHFYRHPEGYED